MILRTLPSILAQRLKRGAVVLSMVPLAITGCDSGADTDKNVTPGEVGTVSGALTADFGNQNASEAALSSGSSSVDVRAQTSTVAVASVDDRGETTVVTESSVQAGGRFSVETDSREGPFVVQALDANGHIVGMVIVPQDLEDDGTVVTAPISQETTAEAQVFLQLLAGTADRDDIDTVGLMTAISAELAATVTTDDLALAVAAAQEASLEVMARSNAAITASAVNEAKLALFVALSASLDAASDTDAENTAWFTFMSDLNSRVAASANVSSQTQSDAAAAAAVAFRATLEATSSANTETRSHALALTSTLSAMADFAAQTEAVASSSASATVEAKLEASYLAFVDSVRTSADSDAMAMAYARLVANVSGQGNANADSAFDALLSAEGAGEASLRAELAAAVVATSDAATQLEADLDAATQTSVNAEAIADAFVDFRAAADTAFRGALVASFSDSVVNFGSEAANQTTGDARTLFELDLLGEVTIDIGFNVVGDIFSGLGLQAGATGLLSEAGAAGIDLLGALDAELVALEASGDLVVVATGAVDSTSRTFTFADITTTTSSTTFVRVVERDTGEVRGMVEVTSAVDGETDLDVVRAMTTETTIQSQVIVQLVANGMAESDIDRATVETYIDAAVAGAVQSQGDVNSLAAAIAVAAAVRAERLGTTTALASQSSADARADLQSDLSAATSASSNQAETAHADFDAAVRAALAAQTGATADAMGEADATAAASFEAALQVLASGNAELVAAGEARGQIEAALALQGSLEVALSGSSMAQSRIDEVDAAVEAMIAATLDATSEADIEASGQAFVDATLRSSGEAGVLDDIIGLDLELEAADALVIDTAIAASFTAAATFEAAVTSAISGASDSNGLDVTAATNAIVAASAAFGTELDAALTLSSLTTVNAADQAAIANLIAQVAVGLYGEAAVSVQ